MASTESTEISAYDRMCWPDGELERALAQGAHRLELSAYLGVDEYRLLAALAHSAQAMHAAQARSRARTVRRRAPTRARLYVLPGILGSQLGRPRSAAPPDLLWLDPSDVLRGRLTELRLGHPRTLVPLGAIVYTYLALKLRLQAAGFDVVVHDYDWRCDLTQTGAALAARLDADDSPALALIGHSMGGLLARSALAQCSERTLARLRWLIDLGTPHGGSMGAVQTLRASYPMVNRLAALDPLRDVGALTAQVFRGFPSLYQLLPADCDVPLFEPDAWPRQGPQPRRKLLAAASRFHHWLNDAQARLRPTTAQACIVGIGQRTVTGLARRRDQFEYQISSAGDGTVAAARATLAAAQCFSLRCEHSELPREALVAAAIADLLDVGGTRRLRAGARAAAGTRLTVTDRALRRVLAAPVDWTSLSITERRQYLNRLNAPPSSYFPLG